MYTYSLISRCESLAASDGNNFKKPTTAVLIALHSSTAQSVDNEWVHVNSWSLYFVIVFLAVSSLSSFLVGPPPPSAAEIARRQKLEHMRREHLAALELEGGCVCMCKLASYLASGTRLMCKHAFVTQVYCFLLLVPEHTVKARLELIKNKAIQLIKQLKVSAMYS